MTSLRSGLAVALAGVLLAVAIGVFVIAVTRSTRRPVEAAPGELLYREVMTRVERDYVVDVDRERLVYAAAKAIVAELDPHSRVYATEEWDRFREESRGELSGIGASVVAIGDAAVVADVVPGGPAARAGVVALERIVAIEGVDLDAAAVRAGVAARLAGPADSAVRVSVARRDGTQRRNLTLVRTTGDAPTVHARMLDAAAGLALVRIDAFRANTRDLVDRALATLDRASLRGLVLDLRFNRGGDFDPAVDLARLWIPSGTIVTTRGRHESREFSARGNAPFSGLPTVVLVNGESASASEVLAGALQDWHAALLLGERTFGKGVLQRNDPFETWAGGIKLTTAHWFTPGGRCPEAHIPFSAQPPVVGGLAPDVVVAMADDERERLRTALARADLPAGLARELADRDRAAGLSEFADRQQAMALGLLRGRAADTPAR